MSAAAWTVAEPDVASVLIDDVAGWTVKAPSGQREWTGAPNQRAAIELANTLADIDTMLQGISRPRLTVVAGGSP